MIQALALKIGIAVAILLGACAATWFGADAHYSQQYAALKASYEAAAKAQQAQVVETIASNAQASKVINDEAQQQIGSMASTITALLVRKPASGGAISVCTTTPSPAGPPIQPVRSATPASPGPVAIPARPSVEAAIDPSTLTDSLTVGIDAIKAELLWRDYARRTGQVK